MAYRLVTKSDDLGWTLAYFSGVKVFNSRYLAHYLAERDKNWQHWRSTKRNLFPEFRELWSGVPWYHAATCISRSL